MKLTYIYGLLDPRTNQLRYVGKSDYPEQRLGKHLRDARRGAHTHKESWIRGLLQSGLEPTLIYLMQVPMKRWQRVERRLLRSLAESGYDLVNLAEGGLGGATRKKGYKRPLAVRQKISASHKNLWNDERRAVWSERARRQHKDPEFREKHLAGLEKAKPRISENQQRRWANEEERQRQSEVGRRNWQDPALRKEMCEKIAACWQDPEYKERQHLARLEAWKRRKRAKSTSN